PYNKISTLCLSYYFTSPYGRALLFGAHPYGHPIGGSEHSLAGIERADVLKYYDAEIGADRLTLVFAGDFAPATLCREVAQAFSGWRTAGALFGSSQKVFAHYFYPFPLSEDNLPSAQDYYNKQYLTLTGESGKWLAQGGFLRQRPLPVPVNFSANWRLLNMETEVRMAIARGITGFTVDVLSLDASVAPNGQLYLMLQAAQAVDPRFKIAVMPDIDGLGSDASAVVQIIASVASSPAAYRLADGRLVVTAFNASLHPPSWGASVIRQLNAQGINVAFVPTFLGWSGQASAFASISYGFADWGTATPAASSAMQGDAAIAHNTYGKIYMMPVDPQQYRPKDFVYWEAGNSAAFRDAWMSSIQGGADWVQLVTWSD